MERAHPAQCIGTTGPSFYQILRLGQFPVVQVHVPLRGRDIRMRAHPDAIAAYSSAVLASPISLAKTLT